MMMSSRFGFSSAIWRRGVRSAGIGAVRIDSFLTGFHAFCYSTRVKVKPQPPMEKEGDAFYVVRKGDVVGIYKSLSDCQAQVSSSVCDPPVSVYKGYSLSKETEDYLASRGLKHAQYTIDAVDAKDDMFGTLVSCPFRQPEGNASVAEKESQKVPTQKRNKEEAMGSGSNELPQKNAKIGYTVETQAMRGRYLSCILEFDGASKGNPGKAGAGAIIRTHDGNLVSRVRQGLGVVTNNVAEYRALILGMQYALSKGFKEILVQGDSLLVCKQVQGIWQTKNHNMADLCKAVKGLKDMFVSFQIKHVKREFNSDADAQANLAVDLANGEIYEESEQLTV